MENPEACCGAGGAFFLDSGELAGNVRARKVRDIKETGASVVVTQCPACRSFLGPCLEGVEVMHPVELLAKAYAGR